MATSPDSRACEAPERRVSTENSAPPSLVGLFFCDAHCLQRFSPNMSQYLNSPLSRRAAVFNQLPMDMLSSAMSAQHPHFGATYRTDQQSDGSFCVEVSIPDTSLVTVTGFGTEELAAVWVASHQHQV